MRVFGRTPINLRDVSITHGQVYVIIERCKGCNFCVQFCPYDVLQLSEQINAKGYHYPEVTAGKEQSCIHCEFCTMICPEFAIYTLEAPV